MSAKAETPVVWTWPCSLADMQLIDGLDDHVRAAVERYARQTPVSRDNTEYEQGWEDAMEEARNQLDTVHFPTAPRTSSRRSFRGER